MNDVKNRLICGMAGSGKTFFVKKEIPLLVSEGFHLLLFAPVGEYTRFFEHLGITDFHKVPKLELLNPFYFLENFHDKNMFQHLKCFFSSALERELNEHEESSIYSCVEHVKEVKEREFSLTYFLTKLREEKIGKSLSFEFLMKNKNSVTKNNFPLPNNKQIILVELDSYYHSPHIYQEDHLSVIAQKIISSWKNRDNVKKLIIFEEYDKFQNKSFSSFLHSLRIPIWSVLQNSILNEQEYTDGLFEEFLLFRLSDVSISHMMKLFPSIRTEVFEQIRHLGKNEPLFFTMIKKR